MTEPTAEENKPRPRPGFEFIPKLKDKKVMIRMGSGGQPITGTLEAYNPYELLIKTAKGSTLVFKRAIATIEVVEEPGGYRPDGW
jgi:sRNA-binding regulator protein Hfq